MAAPVPPRAHPAPPAPPPLRLLERGAPWPGRALPVPWFARLGHWLDRLLAS